MEHCAASVRVNMGQGPVDAVHRADRPHQPSQGWISVQEPGGLGLSVQRLARDTDFELVGILRRCLGTVPYQLQAWMTASRAKAAVVRLNPGPSD